MTKIWKVFFWISIFSLPPKMTFSWWIYPQLWWTPTEKGHRQYFPLLKSRPNITMLGSFSFQPVNDTRTTMRQDSEETERSRLVDAPPLSLLQCQLRFVACRLERWNRGTQTETLKPSLWMYNSMYMRARLALPAFAVLRESDLLLCADGNLAKRGRKAGKWMKSSTALLL